MAHLLECQRPVFTRSQDPDGNWAFQILDDSGTPIGVARHVAVQSFWRKQGSVTIYDGSAATVAVMAAGRREVKDGVGHVVGRIRVRYRWKCRVYLGDGSDTPLGSIDAESVALPTFAIRGVSGAPIGRITPEYSNFWEVVGKKPGHPLAERLIVELTQPVERSMHLLILASTALLGLHVWVWRGTPNLF